MKSVGLPPLRYLGAAFLTLAAVAASCTVPDYPARPSDVGKSRVSGGEGGEGGDSAGGAGERAGAGGADFGDDGGHGGEPLGECGDGAVSGQDCDDHNVQSNDGCSADCRREFMEVSLGAQHTCVRFDDGEVGCWGQNTQGELGLDQSVGGGANRGDEPDELGENRIETNLGSSIEVLALSLGWEFSCVLLKGGKVKCWGANESGQLCNGDSEPVGRDPQELGDNLSPIDLGSDVVASKISCGGQHCCAIVNADGNDRGDVKCWGNNAQGQLGLGDRDNRGDSTATLCDELESVALGSGHTAKSVTAGDYHTCALLDDDSVRCWGLGDSGQLGNGLPDANIGVSSDQMGNYLVPVDLGDGLTAKQIEAGGNHTCAILEDDTLKCWGKNDQGQLGLGDDVNHGTQPEQMGTHLLPVRLGKNRHAERVTAGELFTCALLDDDSVKCWGHNYEGQLGQGNHDRIGTSPTDMGDQLKPVDLGESVLDVAAGGAHACAILDSGRIKCWGFANSGGLGNGDENDNLGDEPDEMGENLPYVPLLKK